MPIPINISASRGAKILNVSKWGTRLEVWAQIMESRYPGYCEKHGITLPEFPDNASIRWGNAFEDAVIKLAENKQDCLISDREKLYTHKKHDFITCHVDGVYLDTKKTLHEGKTTTIYSYNSEWGEPVTDRVPLDYNVQCNHQAMLTGANEVILSVLVFPKRPDEWESEGWTVEYCELTSQWLLWENETAVSPIVWSKSLSEMGYFHTYNIKSDKALQKIMLNEYLDFWVKYVIGKIPPPPTTLNDIKMILKSPVGTIICPPELVAKHNEYKLYNEEMNRAKKIKEQIKLDFLKFGNASQEGKNNPIDDDSVEKWIFRNEFGEKLFSYDGKRFG